MTRTFDRAVKEFLLEAGCTLVRQGKGSHEIWFSPVTKRTFPVPHGMVSRHTANGVLKDAGLTGKL